MPLFKDLGSLDQILQMLVGLSFVHVAALVYSQRIVNVFAIFVVSHRVQTIPSVNAVRPRSSGETGHVGKIHKAVELAWTG